ncbi:glutathione S-transferase C-terminal domain-containing protein [Trabulsiella odontotermitis]|nr:glutathione S-transferase C-terminal domain-containing protein [Trabulsiella odontotermitis]
MAVFLFLLYPLSTQTVSGSVIYIFFINDMMSSVNSRRKGNNTMKLYIADKTCSEAIQIVAHQMALKLELIHVDFASNTTSNGEDFRSVNPLFYVPALVTDEQETLTEGLVILNWLADRNPEAGLAPVPGTMARVNHDQLMTFIATEIQQRHVPLMRKLMTEEGKAWMSGKIIAAYQLLDNRLADGRSYLTGEKLTIADAYLWATFWSERSGVDIHHLQYIQSWKKRMDMHPAVQQALQDEMDIVTRHRSLLSA